MNDCNNYLEAILPYLLVISFLLGIVFFRKYQLFNIKTEATAKKQKITFTVNESDKNFFYDD